MAENVRHHFVPQFYLRNFSCDGGERRQIASYILSRSLFVPSASIKKQAQRSRLYGEQAAEKALGDLEGAAASVIKKAVERRELPKRSSEEYFTLLVFVLFQSLRTPVAAAEINDAFSQFVKLLAADNPEIAPLMDEVKVELETPLLETLRNAALHHPLVLDLGAKLLVNRTDTPLITSDHPVVLYNQFMERRRAAGSGIGIASKGLQVFLPLSPECCLILFDHEVYRVGGRSLSGIQIALTSEDVKWLNSLQVANADTQLFFNSAVSERDVRSLVEAASKWRLATRSKSVTQPDFIGPGGSVGTLIHQSRAELRIGLRLSAVGELPSAQQYKLGSTVVHLRNPVLCDLHRKFLKQVDDGAYQASEFGAFVKAQEAATH